jgi:hypothetical protein
MRGILHGIAFALKFVACWIFLVALHEDANFSIQGGGEEQGLAIVRDLVQKTLYFRQKAHVGHTVGFIDHNDFNFVEAHIAALDEVSEATGASNSYVAALTQSIELITVANATIKRINAKLAGCSDGLELLGDLGAEFTGGGEDEHAWALGARAAFTEAGNAHNAKGQGLARARWGFATEVAAGKAIGDSGLLDGKRFFYSLS